MQYVLYFNIAFGLVMRGREVGGFRQDGHLLANVTMSPI